MIRQNPTFKFLALSTLALSLSTATPAFAETAGQFIDDATITTKVKAAILANKSLKVMDVSVETVRGNVSLSGTVDTKTQEEEAIRTAKMVEGVAKVTDNLTVKDEGGSGY